MVLKVLSHCWLLTKRENNHFEVYLKQRSILVNLDLLFKSNDVSSTPKLTFQCKGWNIFGQNRKYTLRQKLFFGLNDILLLQMFEFLIS